jgi:hypothetical protein
VLKSLASRLTTVASRVLRRVSTIVRDASQPVTPVFGLVTDLLRPRRLLLAENVLLRQQLLVLRRQIRRPNLTAFDRIVIVAASAVTGTWHESVHLVKPETVLRWHRRGFQIFWRWRTRDQKPQARVSMDTVELIRRMARENPCWLLCRIAASRRRAFQSRGTSIVMMEAAEYGKGDHLASQRCWAGTAG